MKSKIRIQVYAVTELLQVGYKTKRVIAGIDVNGGPFPNIPFDAYGSLLKDVEQLKNGDLVDVEFDIQGKFYTDKTGKERHFVTLQALKIKSVPDVISSGWQQIRAQAIDVKESTKEPVTSNVFQTWMNWICEKWKRLQNQNQQ
jgi:hypothetical protein